MLIIANKCTLYIMVESSLLEINLVFSKAYTFLDIFAIPLSCQRVGHFYNVHTVNDQR